MLESSILLLLTGVLIHISVPVLPDYGVAMLTARQLGRQAGFALVGGVFMVFDLILLGLHINGVI